MTTKQRWSDCSNYFHWSGLFDTKLFSFTINSLIHFMICLCLFFIQLFLKTFILSFFSLNHLFFCHLLDEVFFFLYLFFIVFPFFLLFYILLPLFFYIYIILALFLFFLSSSFFHFLLSFHFTSFTLFVFFSFSYLAVF